MWYLVKLISNNHFFICAKNRLMLNGPYVATVKLKRKRCKVSIITASEEKNILHNLALNLNHNYPRIFLTRSFAAVREILQPKGRVHDDENELTTLTENSSPKQILSGVEFSNNVEEVITDTCTLSSSETIPLDDAVIVFDDDVPVLSEIPFDGLTDHDELNEQSLTNICADQSGHVEIIHNASTMENTELKNSQINDDEIYYPGDIEVINNTNERKSAEQETLRIENDHQDNSDIDGENIDDKNSEYVPSEDSDDSDIENDPGNNNNESSTSNQQNNTFTMANSSAENGLSLNDSKRKSGVVQEELTIDFSESSEGRKKANFCYYCKTLQLQLPRHLSRKHKDKTPVKNFLAAMKGSVERRKIIDTIRRHGNALHNRNPLYNKGKMIVVRRPSKKNPVVASDFAICASCKGSFRKKKLSAHYNKCAKNPKKGSRSVQVLSRRIEGNIHPTANETLRKQVFPVLREDEVVRSIRYDELAILYGNWLCDKHTLKHQDDLIRARLRLVGRFWIEIKRIKPELENLSMVFHPKQIRFVAEAIKDVAGWDSSKREYISPTNGTLLCTIMNQMAIILKDKYIEDMDKEKKNEVEDFMSLSRSKLPLIIAKSANESRIKKKRAKKIVLPTIDDIRSLTSYLNAERKKAFTALKQKFSRENWLVLAKTLLLSIQIFNRRRPGDIERMSIEDFQNYQSLKDSDPDGYKTLSDNSRKLADTYVRGQLRGKLGRTVPLLITKQQLAEGEILIRTRHKLGVSNNYLFCEPDGDNKTHPYLRACKLMREYSVACNAKYSTSLRSTRLRQQLATHCLRLNIDDNQISDVADFLGHDKAIHKSHYRQPITSRDILSTSTLLQKAAGIDVNDSDESSDESDSNDSTAEDNVDDDIAEQNNNPGNQGQNQSTNRNTDEPSELKSDTSEEETDYQTPIKNSNLTKRKLKDIQESGSDESFQKKKQKRSTPPYGKTIRRRWNNDETETAKREFRTYLSNNTLPSFKIIQEVMKKNPSLHGRSREQIKVWIKNQQVKNSKKHHGQNV